MRLSILTLAALCSHLLLLGCQDSDQLPNARLPAPLDWSWAVKSESAALLSVHGTSEHDVWMAGADDGSGPLVLHYDGSAWQRRDAGVKGDLWWINATPQGSVFFAGASALLLRYRDGVFERLKTPGLGKDVVYGVWARAEDDVYAVGTSAGHNGFIWHFDGSEFQALTLPDTLPLDENHDQPGFFKVWGNATSVWVAGANGTLLRGDAQRGFELVRQGGSEILFTVTARGSHVAAVGGNASGLLLETHGGPLVDHTPSGTPLLQGVWIDESDALWAVGVGGTVLRSSPSGIAALDTGLDFAANDSLHAVWVDPKGGVWAVGGDVLSPNLAHGVALHGGADVPQLELQIPAPVAPSCPEAQVDPAPQGSIARRWNEQILGAIRRDLPRPGVHARNLFHTSVAIWDAFAAYDDTFMGYLVTEHSNALDVGAARQEAISYAAYRVLVHRYSGAVGGAVSRACFNAFMTKLGYDPEQTSAVGSSPRALGNRIGQAVIDAFASDGANEANNYADPESFEPDSPNLLVDRPGSHATDPLLWQRLVLAKAETQNGIPANAGAQVYIGGHWGKVTPFSLQRTLPDRPYFDVEAPALELDSATVDAAVDVLRKSSELDVENSTRMDVSPGALGNNALGTNDGRGYQKNPVTGKSYAPLSIKRSDFGRVLAEFWADGPNSETPPGHWNVIANHVADDPAFERRLFGSGPELDSLAWDAHTYLAMNGALHDAAIAAWELKRLYVTSRPITLLRYMAEHGQRSDSSLPGYDARGLPLIAGLIELITPESSAPGERHERLARHVGQIAVRSWRGEPGDRVMDVAGVGWILGVEWIPYQRRTFVTPAFPGYVSGHSTFSRAAATVLTELTGSEYFPGGLASFSCVPGYLFFERGPSAPTQLHWATYYDAADQAGQSRIWGGIHLTFDDLAGRKLGAQIGEGAVLRARRSFAH